MKKRARCANRRTRDRLETAPAMAAKPPAAALIQRPLNFGKPPPRQRTAAWGGGLKLGASRLGRGVRLNGGRFRSRVNGPRRASLPARFAPGSCELRLLAQPLEAAFLGKSALAGDIIPRPSGVSGYEYRLLLFAEKRQEVFVFYAVMGLRQNLVHGKDHLPGAGGFDLEQRLVLPLKKVGL